MIHHGFKKGKKVFVKLKDGTQIIDKFIDSTSQHLILQEHKIKWSNIRCTTISKKR